MTKSKEYYYIPLKECVERISECLDIRKVIKCYIQDNVANEDSWNSDLMMLLAESYAINFRYTELMNDLILTPPSPDEETSEEIITVDSQKYAMMTSYSQLMIVNEIELKNSHRVHLFFH